MAGLRTNSFRSLIKLTKKVEEWRYFDNSEQVKGLQRPRKSEKTDFEPFLKLV